MTRTESVTYRIQCRHLSEEWSTICTRFTTADARYEIARQRKLMPVSAKLRILKVTKTEEVFV